MKTSKSCAFAILPLVLVLAVFCQPKSGAADADTATVKGEIKALDSKAGPIPFQPPGEMIEFKTTAGSAEIPDQYHNPKPGKLTLGGKDFSIALARKSDKSAGYDVLLIDSDRDGRFTENEAHALSVTGRPGPANQKMQTGTSDRILIGSANHATPVTIEYRDFPGSNLMARVSFLEYLEAGAQIAGETVRVAVLDKDNNNHYGDPVDLWTLAKGQAWDRRPQTEYGLSGTDEGRFLDGHRYTIKIDKENQITLRAEPSKEPRPEDLAKQRVRVEHLWASRFDQEREKFVKDRGVDASRPRAERPIEWQYITFDEASALSKKSGKPLFVDAMAFWCVWCYRMDYYTYIDKEVAQLLSEKFIPVKIVQEHDRAGDYQRVMDAMKARGIPAMGVWNAKGELVHQIGGWKEPVAFVADLRKALAASR